MAGVKRYSPGEAWDGDVADMCGDTTGDYVEYDDYKNLEEELSDLKADVAGVLHDLQRLIE